MDRPENRSGWCDPEIWVNHEGCERCSGMIPMPTGPDLPCDCEHHKEES